MKSEGYKLLVDYPGCKYNVGDIITKSKDEKLYNVLVSGKYRDCFKEVNVNSIYNFENNWKPLSELVYQDIENKKLWIWCEYPGGGESRELMVDCLDVNPYIYCKVEFTKTKEKSSRIAQGAVCYSINKNIKSPYV